jgi:hypothetical protein
MIYKISNWNSFAGEHFALSQSFFGDHQDYHQRAFFKRRLKTEFARQSPARAINDLERL